MTSRISAERLAELIKGAWPFEEDRRAAFTELQRSRETIAKHEAFVSQVRELAEPMEKNIKDLGTPDRGNPRSSDMDDEADQREIEVTQDYLSAIDSLLASGQS